MWNLHEDISRRRDPHRGLRLRSAVPGRICWEVEALRNRPRKAAAVAMALWQRVGIHSAEATPLTGRLLVRYDTNVSSQEITAMVRTALRTRSLSPEAYVALRGSPHGERHGSVSTPVGSTNGHVHDHALDGTALQSHLMRTDSDLSRGWTSSMRPRGPEADAW